MTTAYSSVHPSKGIFTGPFLTKTIRLQMVKDDTIANSKTSADL